MGYKVPMEYGVATPVFEIWLDDREIAEEYYKLIEEVDFESHITGSDIATIFMHDPKLQVIDDKRIFKGKKVKLFGGWQGDIVKWLDGYVSMIDIEFPESGKPTITLHCMDESFILDRLDVYYSYHDRTFSQIAAEIAKRHGLTTDGPATSFVHENVSQSGESDMRLLVRLADEVDNNLIVKVRDGKIIWWDRDKKFNSQTKLNWRNPPFELKTFRPRITVADRREGMDRADIHDGTKTVDEGVATPDMIQDRKILGEDSPGDPEVTQRWVMRDGMWYREEL